MKNDQETKELDNSLKLIARSSIIVFIILFFSKILAYTYKIIIARYFGPEIYGMFSLAVMVMGWFLAFSTFGLYDGLLRYVSFYRGKNEIDKIRYTIKVSLVVSFFSSVVAGIILFSLSEFIAVTFFKAPNLTFFLKVLSVFIPITILSNIFLFIIRAFEKISWYSFIRNILESIIKIIFLIIFICIGLKTNAVIFSYVLGIFGILIVSYLFCKYKLPQIFGKYELKKTEKKKLIYNLFSYSWPLMFIGVISSVFYWIDSFAIGYFRETIEVGFYHAAIPIAALLNQVPDIFMRIFFPLITKEFSKKNFNLIKELSNQVWKWIFIATLPIFLILILFPGAIINLLFGPNYLNAANALRILSIGAFFSAIFGISYNLISMAGKSKLLLIDIIITSIINLLLNITLVPKYGINGAAFSTSLSFVILNLIFLFQTKQYFSIKPLGKNILKIILAAIIPTFLLIYTKQFIEINFFTLIVLGSFFILCYILLILVLNCLDETDFMILKAIKRKAKLRHS